MSPRPSAKSSESATTSQPGWIMGPVRALDSLIGAHPAALLDLYREGRPIDSAELEGRLRGRMLGIPVETAFMLMQPLVVLFARHIYPWRGKRFDAGGMGGHNFFVRGQGLRFRCEPAPSEIDGRPTLLILYDLPGNLWPVSRMVDELRFVGDTVMIGPSSLRTRTGSLLFAWWGLETSP